MENSIFSKIIFGAFTEEMDWPERVCKKTRMTEKVLMEKFIYKFFIIYINSYFM